MSAPNVFRDRPADYERHRRLVRVPDEPCIACGRAVRPGRGVVIEITIDGEIIPAGDPRSGVFNVSHGCFPLGRRCAIRLGVKALTS